MCRGVGQVGYVFLHCIGLSCLAEMFPKSTAELGPARLKQPKFDFGQFADNPRDGNRNVSKALIRTVHSEQRCVLLFRYRNCYIDKKCFCGAF